MLTQRFEDALIYATQTHARQLRKATQIPYVSHLLGVVSLVLEHGGDEDEAIAALLHDAIEDQGGDARRQDIRARFGERVTEIVDGCTDAETIPKPPWRKRKEAYIAHLGEASPSVRLVSAADKLHNIRAIIADYRTHGEALWNRFSGGRETLWYYRALSDKFHSVTTESDPPGLHALLKELECAVADLERLANP